MNKEKIIKMFEEYGNAYSKFTEDKKEITNDTDLTTEGKDKKLSYLREEFVQGAINYGKEIISALDNILKEHQNKLSTKAQEFANNSGHQLFINNCVALLKNKRTLTSEERIMIQSGLKDDILGIQIINQNIPMNSNITPFEIPEDNTVKIIGELKETVNYYIIRQSKGCVDGAMKYCISKINENFDNDFNYVDNKNGTSFAVSKKVTSFNKTEESENVNNG